MKGQRHMPRVNYIDHQVLKARIADFANWGMLLCFFSAAESKRIIAQDIMTGDQSAFANRHRIENG